MVRNIRLRASVHTSRICLYVCYVTVWACATYRISSILVRMFSAYDRSLSRVTRSLTRSWSSLANSTSATVRPILRFCLHVAIWGWSCLSKKIGWSSAINQNLANPKYKYSELTSLPEILKVSLYVREQRVLQCLNMLSVYFLWDQFCPSPVCKYMHTHSHTLFSKYQRCVHTKQVTLKLSNNFQTTDQSGMCMAE